MLTKNECMSILVKLGDTGIDVNDCIKQLLVSNDIPIEVLKFIVANKGIEVVNFYEMLRIKHNKNKSPLYTNILKEQADIEEIITTLACLLVQVVLYNKKLDNNNDIFLKEVRAAEISFVLNDYFINKDITKAVSLLKLIKSDLLVLEYLNGRRELN